MVFLDSDRRNLDRVEHALGTDYTFFWLLAQCSYLVLQLFDQFSLLLNNVLVVQSIGFDGINLSECGLGGVLQVVDHHVQEYFVPLELGIELFNGQLKFCNNFGLFELQSTYEFVVFNEAHPFVKFNCLSLSIYVVFWLVSIQLDVRLEAR